MKPEEDCPFYSRPETERTAITLAAIYGRRTVLERWASLGDSEANGWTGRASMAAKWLADDESVADLGCGTMNLERYLRPDQRYVPIDVVARDTRTIVCDFNCEPPPRTSARAAACLGLIEYLYDPASFLAILRRQYGSMVVSYCVSDAPGAPENRRQNAWVNDFTAREIRQVFQRTDWTVRREEWVDELQMLWWLEAEAA